MNLLLGNSSFPLNVFYDDAPPNRGPSIQSYVYSPRAVTSLHWPLAIVMIFPARLVDYCPFFSLIFYFHSLHSLTVLSSDILSTNWYPITNTQIHTQACHV
ncbi:hypothetical protein, unlikely [Trypanosoma brucei gambiense DAL972]|uniref:Uncharacterized protein n=1 Tax=Trypanosoma brucei gambiense (strain MHOM/CI/86/DAL972) TaxID=679716 RepID=C9ZPC8_TRYB9|nr:hypothetical protein, unlikely [Trypanosoma brucei gambiense DAL972]CBH11256.1 hypothetical protein, unlikely [Trypanosoma brucei gambiense DAL972]|eukprot:XP_011773543.1 hypothetical protein, unlikely [Trypanosoma brucei gambiense DAL972]